MNLKNEEDVKQNCALQRGPVGIRVHLTGDQEMRMKAKGYRRRVRNVTPLRHMLEEIIFGKRINDNEWYNKG